MRNLLYSVIFGFFIALFWNSSFFASASTDENFFRSKEHHDPVESILKRAADGDAEALYQLATLYDRGYDTIPVDSAISTGLYRLSAEKGFPRAMNYLGFKYYNGDYVARNIDSALYWIRKSADAGDITAAGNLGYLLTQSDDIPHDYKEALFWLGKAAESGLPSAFTQLGDLYRTGMGCVPDTVKAIALYEKGIKAGAPDSDIRLIHMMRKKWESLPPDTAIVNPRHYGILGYAYSRGLGVEYNHQKSLENFLKGALLGDPSSEFILGETLEIFPDILNTEENRETIRFWNINELPAGEIDNPLFWYEKAAAKGIKDSDAAYEALF